ncbi:MAG: NAD(P)-dependent oxidoreductase [Arenicellales bacterium]|nr:NAD(P)-dependent oxidoreductase [Arenicellales bacterium]
MAEYIGFIGLGSMGLPMTRVLADAGYAMRVYDVSTEACDRAAAIGDVSVCDDVSGVAGAVDVLLTCVPNDAILRELYLGDKGVRDTARGDQISIDCSTVSPSLTREINQTLSEQRVSHLDASMLGSIPQAESGQIGFVVGGDQATFDKVLPLLNVLGKMVKYVGGSGSGNQVKLIHQTLVAGHAVAVAEALSLCMATETDLDAFYDVVCNGGGFAYSRYLEKRTPRMRAGDFSPLFMLDLMAKDAGLARDLAREVSMATPLLDRVLETFDLAQKAGYGREDFSAVARVYEKNVGRHLNEH